MVFQFTKTVTVVGRYEVEKLTASQRLDLNLEKGRMRDELQVSSAGDPPGVSWSQAMLVFVSVC